MNNFKKRLLSNLVGKALKIFPVLIITGSRQTGKTTLVKKLLSDTKRKYYSFDDIDLQEQARREPESLLTSFPVTFDEVQRVPEFLLSIKKVVDSHRKPGMIILAGSANFSLLNKITESLAGRAYYLELLPFCPREWQMKTEELSPIDKWFDNEFTIKDWPIQKNNWKNCLLRGGFPPRLNLGQQVDAELWFAGYIQTYLERDLYQLQQVSSLADFKRIMQLTANRVGRLLNQSDIARDAGVPQATCHRYFNLLETSCQIMRLPVYSTNPNIPVVKSKKLFWKDSGVGSYLAGIKNIALLEQRNDLGFWLEQQIFQTLQVWQAMDPINRNIFYWRDRKGNEVDFILEKDQRLIALEVKNSSKIYSHDLKGLKIFEEVLLPRKKWLRSIILFNGQTARPLGSNDYALPLGWFT